MAAYQTVYTHTLARITSYMICRHINTEMTVGQTYTTEK